MLQLLKSWNIEQGSFVREILLREFAKVSILNVYQQSDRKKKHFNWRLVQKLTGLTNIYWTQITKYWFINVIRQGLDAFGLATLDSFTSVASTSIMPFSGSRPFNSLTEEDMTNLITFYRLISLFSGRRGSETVRNSSFPSAFCKWSKIKSFFFMFAPSILQQVQAVSKYGEGRLTPLDEASLVMNQLPSAEEMLPILSILPEVTSLHNNTSPNTLKVFWLIPIFLFGYNSS